LYLRRREFSITKYGFEIVTFVDETFQHNNQVIGAKKLYQLLKKKAIGAVVMLNNSQEITDQPVQQVPQELQLLLSEYEDVFKEHDTLSPPRAVDHTIQLLDNAKPVNQRQYRLPFHKKNAMKN
jgi:hypothetical protein